PGTSLARAQEADDVAAIGVEPELTVGQGARIGGEDHPGGAVRGRELTVARAHVPALVADLPHQLPAAVLEDGVTEVTAEADPDLTQLLRRVALDGQAAQGDQAPALLQLTRDLGQGRGQSGEGKALTGGPLPRETGSPDRRQG